jgi:hypothetical protein
MVAREWWAGTTEPIKRTQSSINFDVISVPPVVMLLRQRWYGASDLKGKQLIGRYIFLCRSIYIESYRKREINGEWRQ